jgi:hypothetical protein
MTVPTASLRRSQAILLLRCSRIAVFLSLAALAADAQNQLWIRQLGTMGDDWARAAASDGFGGVYLGGQTSGNLGGPNAGHVDAWVARYDGAGNRVWARQLGTAAYDTVGLAATDGLGGVFVGGASFGSFAAPNAGMADAWLGRYDSAGNLVWIRQFGTGALDAASAAAPDGAGGVYIGGLGNFGMPTAPSYGAWVARYDAGGNRLWMRTLVARNSEVSACASDGSGGVFASGWTEGNLAGTNAGVTDVWVARYDGAGNELWVRQFGTNTYDRLRIASPDGSGGVYVGGETSGSLGGPNAGERDAWLARYDGAGDQDWIRQFGTLDFDLLSASAADASGGLFVAGSSVADLGGPNAGMLDAWLARYDSAGNQAWILQFGTDGSEHAAAAAPDGTGGVYLGGRCSSSFGGPFAGGYEDAWLARYEASCSANYSYCTAKLSSNSCLPAIAVNGTPSASAGSGFTISTTSMLDNKFGKYFYSKSGPSNAPFQGGFLCVQPPLVRTMLQNSGGIPPCGGSFQLDFNAYVASGKDPALVAGQQVWIQAWSRDPGYAPPDNISLSDAVSFTLCP